jgi:tRNA dimethylallyltransferase
MAVRKKTVHFMAVENVRGTVNLSSLSLDILIHHSMPPFFITGPTASGKSAIALALAERVGGEIINGDAFQLYQGLDLLTAKPSRADRARVPHHLYDSVPPTDSCDAQRYRELVLPIIADITARGQLPIIVGGSGLYIKALSHGLADLPRGDDRLRAELNALTLDAMVAQLLSLDPQAGENVPLANPRYVQRALEICLLTGQPQSALRQNFAQTEPAGQGVLLHWPRETLYDRTDQRVHEMLAAGLLDEIRAYNASRSHPPAAPWQPELPFEKAIGLKEMQAHLAGQLSLTDAISAMQQSTRRYAKRQSTWFKRERWLQTICLDSNPAAESVICQILDLFPCLTSSRPPIPSPST